MLHYIYSLSDWKKHLLFILMAVAIIILINLLYLSTDIWGPLYLVSLGISIVYLFFLFKQPGIGLITVTGICFLSGFFSREVVELPYASMIDLLLGLTVIATFLSPSFNKEMAFRSDLSILMFMWLCISLLQVANPEGASIQGWAGEIRYLAIYPFLITLIAFTTVKTNEHLNLLLILFIVLAFIACLGGLKQHHLGLTTAEQEFLDSGGAVTHLLWGKLRVFSFYDAARFGCLMAQFAIISTVLAFGKLHLWKRVALLIFAGFFTYGMLLSGTRTALIVIIAGAFYAILASKNFKILILGGMFMFLFLGILKFTNIGNGHYEIYRLRSAVDPQDASLNVRFTSQQALRQYMQSRPFGAGIGVIGYYGHKFNSDKFPSTIEPDSYWVKVWVMYGIVGMIIWFGMYMYIFGKCFGIIWNIKDTGLRYKLIALSSSSFGIFFCSYGNEILNTFPSLLVAAVGFVIIYKGPSLDQEIRLRLNKEKICH